MNYIPGPVKLATSCPLDARVVLRSGKKGTLREMIEQGLIARTEKDGWHVLQALNGEEIQSVWEL